MLDKEPAITCVYFHAKWNPDCEKIQKDYENICNKYQGVTHISVDCDEHPVIKYYFNARVEPSFLILVKGAKLERMIGYNFDKLEALLEKASELHNGGFEYYGDSGN